MRRRNRWRPVPDGKVACFRFAARKSPKLWYDPVVDPSIPNLAERWLSGRKQRFAKPSYWQNRYRGFESPPLRQPQKHSLLPASPALGSGWRTKGSGERNAAAALPRRRRREIRLE